MATGHSKTQCYSCNKQTRTLNCGGCLKDFCLNCLSNHLQMLSKELDEIEYDHDLFRQILNDQKNNPTNNQFMKEINQWEEESINKIKQTAEQCRQTLSNYTETFFIDIENKLNDIAIQLKIIRQDNQFNEIDIDMFKEKFKILKEELDNPSTISIQQQSSPFINEIFIIRSFHKDKKWKQNGITIAGGNGYGDDLNQLNYPFSIAIPDDETIFITNSGNDRIIEWKSNQSNGRIILGGNPDEEQINQLFGPTDILIDKQNNSLILAECGNRRIMEWSYQNNINGQMMIPNIFCIGLAMDKKGYLYTSDYENNEVKRWKKGEEEIIVAAGNGVGDHLNQLNGPNFIFIDDEQSLYVSDEKNHRIMKWINGAKEGIVVAGGNGQGNNLKQLSSPQGVIVDQLGQIYVADRDNHRIMRWSNHSQEGTIIVGGNGKGGESNQLNSPTNLSFNSQGDLYVVDHENHRIQKFEIY